MSIPRSRFLTSSKFRSGVFHDHAIVRLTAIKIRVIRVRSWWETSAIGLCRRASHGSFLIFTWRIVLTSVYTLIHNLQTLGQVYHMCFMSPKSEQPLKQLAGYDGTHFAILAGVKYQWDHNKASHILRQSSGRGAEPWSFAHVSQYKGVGVPVLFSIEEYSKKIGPWVVGLVRHLDSKAVDSNGNSWSFVNDSIKWFVYIGNVPIQGSQKSHASVGKNKFP